MILASDFTKNMKKRGIKKNFKICNVTFLTLDMVDSCPRFEDTRAENKMIPSTKNFVLVTKTDVTCMVIGSHFK